MGQVKPKKLVADSLECFFQTISLYADKSDELSRVYRRYTQQDEFGDTDISKSLDKISIFAEKNITKWGLVPVGDVVKLLVTFIELLGQNDTTQEDKSNTSVIGSEYEERCYSTLIDKGYKVTETPPSGDYGADLIAEKEELTFCIQCKNHSKPIGVSAIQQAFSAKDYYTCDFAVVVSETKFTNAALNMADKLSVICVHTSDLHKILDKCEQYL